MKTPEQVAKQIVGEEIRQLTALEQMAGNPRLFEFMCRIVDGARNGNGNSLSFNLALPAATKTNDRQSTAPNGLTQSVLSVCSELPKGFTISDVVGALKGDKFTFIAKEPKIAVGDVVRRYTGKSIKIIQKGKGRKPHKFEFVGWDETDG